MTGAQATWVLVLVAVFAGMLLPLQPGINAELRLHVRSATMAAAVSFATGLVLLILAAAAMRSGVPTLVELRAAPWWAWLGGAIGAGFVLASLVLAPKLGATLLVGSVVTGQLIASLVIDQYGLVGYKPQPINVGRVLGVCLLVVGVLLVQFSSDPPGTSASPGAAPGVGAGTPIGEPERPD
ncbi:MAG: DMT family transporter [Phycisphaerales bacterium]|nr:MAG: DMT family transporter [Phycisphaerales bacterium]